MTTDWNHVSGLIVAIGTAALAIYAALTFKGLKDQMKLLLEQAASMKRQADAMEEQSKFQNHLFNEQNKAREMDRWLTAYSELLSDITDNVSNRPVPPYMEYHIIKVVHYGSPKLKAQLKPWIGGRGLYKDNKFMKSMEEAKKILIDEIAEKRLN